jgi:clan AA aspartic protease
MMHGIVNSNCEATLRLVVGNTSSQWQVIDAVIDTGFTGFPILPLSIITSINLRLYRREAETLGDRTTCFFDVYRGLVIWDGEFTEIDINASEAAPLIGMSLLYI